VFLKHRSIVALVAIAVILAFLLLPIQNAMTEGAVSTPSGHIGYVRYERSLSCQMIPIGDYYWDHELIIGCTGPQIP